LSSCVPRRDLQLNLGRRWNVLFSKRPHQMIVCNANPSWSWRNLSLVPTRFNREELQNSIMSIGEAVLKEESLRDQIPTLNNAIQTTKSQITGFQKELKELLPKNKEAHTKKLQELEYLCAKAESALQGLRARQRHINDLSADVKHTVESASLHDSRICRPVLSGRPNGRGMEGIPHGVHRRRETHSTGCVLADREERKACTGRRSRKSSGPKKVPVESLPLNQLRELRDTVKGEVGIDAERQRRYDGLLRAIAQLETTHSRTEEESRSPMERLSAAMSC